LNYLSSWAEIPKLVAFLRALDGEKEFHQMPIFVSLPEISRASTWAAAVSFLSLGFAVQIGTQLPFWGSPSLTGILLKDLPQISGGVLLASPTFPDGQAQAQEMISHIQSRSFEK
jgi:hydroxylamine reductase (hybrid-cluster protein)